jgi:hypothetical protein
MTATTTRDWSDVPTAAKELAANWQKFECFVWFRGHDLPDAANWMIWYASSPQSGLIEESNQKVIADRLAPFAAGDDPDLVFEEHSHWVVNSLTGFSLRVFRADGTPTTAFEAFCRVQEALDGYPILDEQDYSDREYEATLDNYRNEMWKQKDQLPEGWADEVYDWFSDHGHDFTESRDDRGGWAPREKITEALTDLGLLPRIVLAKRSGDST